MGPLKMRDQIESYLPRRSGCKSSWSRIFRSCILIMTRGYATWFTTGGAIRIAHYDVIYDVIIWVQNGNYNKWLERILVLVCSTI